MPPTVFIVSDGTGITAETFAHSILSQFDQKFRLVRVPFVDSTEKAYATLEKINEAAHHEGRRPIVFTTLEVGRASPPPGPFTSLRTCSS